VQRLNLLTGKTETKEVKERLPTTPGCNYCPLNNVLGINKLIRLEHIRRRKVFVWGQSPGAEENAKFKELVGPSGQFLWESLAQAGIQRADCDIQNVVRCQPTETHDGRRYNRDPSKAELFCCSIYNHQAMERNRGAAVVHLILGEIAGRQLLGKLYRKDVPIQWVEAWQAYAVVAHHPSYLIRAGGAASGWLYREFLLRMQALPPILENPGRWGYVQSRPYHQITTVLEARVLRSILEREGLDGHRISADMEDGIVDGERVPLMVGFGWGPEGEEQAATIVLDHPENSASPEDRAELRRIAGSILSNQKIEKVCHYGVSDAAVIRELLKVPLRG
jgi:uracil-DNA glycosylase family 4